MRPSKPTEIEFQAYLPSALPPTPIPREIKPAPQHCTCHEQGPPFLRARELGWIAGRQRPKLYEHEDVIRLERGTFCKSCALPVAL